MLDLIPGALRIASAVLFVLSAAHSFAHATASDDFTVRWRSTEDTETGGVVTLHEACASYDCGLQTLGAAPRSRTFIAGRFAPGSLFRGTPPEDRGVWWIVVEAEQKLPMGAAWRKPTAAGDLPPVPLVAAGDCNVEVRSNTGNLPLAEAVVLRLNPDEGANDQGVEPNEFGVWRPWRGSNLTDAAGRAILPVPRAGSSRLLAGASGYRSSTGSCTSGGTTTIFLERLRPLVVQMRTADGVPLRHALARDGNGWPMAVSEPRRMADTEPLHADRWTLRRRGFQV